MTPLARATLASCMLLPIASLAQAAEEIAFDRPGIPFATSALARGDAAWEQGLPDVEWSKAEGTISRQYTAASVLRLGLGANSELQLSTDAQVWRHDSGAQPHRGHGGGDAALGVKIALPSQRADFSWALLAQLSLPTAAAGYGNDESQRSLGTTLQWSLPQDRALALYADIVDAHSGRSWTLAANYTFFARGNIESYVEAATGNGEQGTQGAGAGIAWMLGERVQLDLSLLRGIGDDAPDWQGGIGVAVGFH